MSYNNGNGDGGCFTIFVFAAFVFLVFKCIRQDQTITKHDDIKQKVEKIDSLLILEQEKSKLLYQIVEKKDLEIQQLHVQIDSISRIKNDVTVKHVQKQKEIDQMTDLNLIKYFKNEFADN